MRVMMEFSSKENVVLPMHYNHIIQGFIYSHIADEIFRTFLHEVGFQYEKRNFKLFTYSRIFGKFALDKENNKISFQAPIKIIIASAVDNFINDFTSTVIKAEDMFLGKNPIQLEKFNVMASQDIKNKEIEIKMLSPMLTYSTVTVHGQRKTIYHKPGDEVFNKLLHENLKKKYRAIYGKDLIASSLSIEPINEKKMKKSVLNYKGTVIQGWSGDYRLKGEPVLLKIAYDTGLGSKNAQGFGCFEIINQ